MFPIDFVFPYVDNNDPVWRKAYEKYNKTPEKSKNESNNSARYRDYGLLKYVFRGIERNLPWINHVYLIVSNIEQVPKWIDQTCPRLTIVLHKNIIPEKYLPTFNSQTIEMFIKNIPGLSEYFIYSNDDIFFIKYLKRTDFFLDNGFPVYRVVRTVNKDTNQYRKVCFNEYEMVRTTLKKPPMPNSKYMKPDHFAKPMRLSVMNECYNNFEKQIISSLSRFREDKNMNQYVFVLYHWFMYPYQENRRPNKYFNLTDSDIIKAADALRTLKYNEICLNDNADSNPEKAYRILNPLLNSLLPDKSDFEI